MGKWDNEDANRRGTKGVRGQKTPSQNAHYKQNINWGELNLGESKSGAVSQELDLSFHKGGKEGSTTLRTEYALEGAETFWGAGADPQKVEEALLKMAEDQKKEREQARQEASQKEQEMSAGEKAILQVEELAKAFDEEEREEAPAKEKENAGESSSASRKEPLKAPGEEAPSQEESLKKEETGEEKIEGEASFQGEASQEEKAKEPSQEEESKEPSQEEESKEPSQDFLQSTDSLYRESLQEQVLQKQEQGQSSQRKAQKPSREAQRRSGKSSWSSYRDEVDEIQLFARNFDDQSAIKLMLAQEEEDDEEIFLEAEEHKEKVTAQDLGFCIELKREEPVQEESAQEAKEASRTERKGSEKKATERLASGVISLGKKIFDKEAEEEEEEEEDEDKGEQPREEFSEKKTLDAIEEALSEERTERENQSEDEDFEVIMVMTSEKAREEMPLQEELQTQEETQPEAFDEGASKEDSTEDSSEEKDLQESLKAQDSSEEEGWLDDDEEEWDGSDYDLTIMPQFAFEDEEDEEDSLEEEIFEVEESSQPRRSGNRRTAGSDRSASKGISDRRTSSRSASGRSSSGTERKAAGGENRKEAQGKTGRADSSKETLKRDARPANIRNKAARTLPERTAAKEEKAPRVRFEWVSSFLGSTRGFVLGLFLLILGTAYATVGYYYADHFIPGTVINGVECGNLTAYEAEIKLASELERYSIQVASRNYEPQTILGSSIEYKYLSDGEVLGLLKSQNPLSWLGGFFHKTRYTTTKTVSYNRSLLRSQFKSLNCAKEENQVSPQNAYVAMQGGKFEIIPESQGCALKLKEAYRLLDQAIISGEDSIDFTDGKLYEEPTLFSDSPEMFTMLDAFNNYATAKITYTIGSVTEVLDGDILKTWLEFDSNGDLVKDTSSFDDHIRQYVAELAGRYDTANTVREFKTTSGRTVSVYGYGYGWMMDQEAEYAQLAEEIAGGKQVTREPNWLSKGNAPAPNDIGNTYIEVDMGIQHMYYYQNGYVIFESDIVSGNVNKEGHATPEGIYTLYAKQSPAVLKGEIMESTGQPEYETEVSFWMPFNGGVGFHDAEWQPYFGGDLYQTNGSHGCINLPYYAAATLYDLIDYNVPIICFY